MTVGSSAEVERIFSAWAWTVRASASKIRWLATVGAWASISRSPARVSTFWLKVTWAWPPEEASHRTAGSAGAVAVAALWVGVVWVAAVWVVTVWVSGAAAWWVTAHPDRIAMAAAAAAAVAAMALRRII